MARREMSKEMDTQEFAMVLVPGSRGGCPPENPEIEPIAYDPLREPHPDEPGVKPDGTAAPLESPGRGSRVV
ncbi:MAG TPA: hypothetical protein VH391_00875 [Solirubrobacterales bacterium]